MLAHPQVRTRYAASLSPLQKAAATRASHTLTNTPRASKTGVVENLPRRRCLAFAPEKEVDRHPDGFDIQ
jgi:hypothetical protein